MVHYEWKSLKKGLSITHIYDEGFGFWMPSKKENVNAVGNQKGQYDSTESTTPVQNQTLVLTNIPSSGSEGFNESLRVTFKYNLRITILVNFLTWKTFHQSKVLKKEKIYETQFGVIIFFFFFQESIRSSDLHIKSNLNEITIFVLPLLVSKSFTNNLDNTGIRETIWTSTYSTPRIGVQ